MRPAEVHLEIVRGDTFRATVRFWTDDAKTQPVDLTGAVPAAHMRPTVGAAFVPMTCTLTLPNTIGLHLPPALSATLASAPTKWDLQLTYANGDVRTVLFGFVKVWADATVGV